MTGNHLEISHMSGIKNEYINECKLMYFLQEINNFFSGKEML